MNRSRNPCNLLLHMQQKVAGCGFMASMRFKKKCGLSMNRVGTRSTASVLSSIKKSDAVERVPTLFGSGLQCVPVVASKLPGA